MKIKRAARRISAGASGHCYRFRSRASLRLALSSQPSGLAPGYSSSGSASWKLAGTTASRRLTLLLGGVSRCRALAGTTTCSISLSATPFLPTGTFDRGMLSLIRIKHESHERTPHPSPASIPLAGCSVGAGEPRHLHSGLRQLRRYCELTL